MPPCPPPPIRPREARPPAPLTPSQQRLLWLSLSPLPMSMGYVASDNKTAPQAHTSTDSSHHTDEPRRRRKETEGGSACASHHGATATPKIVAQPRPPYRRSCHLGLAAAVRRAVPRCAHHQHRQGPPHSLNPHSPRHDQSTIPSSLTACSLPLIRVCPVCRVRPVHGVPPGKR